MIETPTPITDAVMEACGKLPNVEMMYGYMTDHAKSLERERGALSRIITHLNAELQGASLHRAEYRERAHKAEGALSDPVLGECEDCGHQIVTPLKRMS